MPIFYSKDNLQKACCKYINEYQFIKVQTENEIFFAVKQTTYESKSDKMKSV